jgi:hypothetical protein
MNFKMKAMAAAVASIGAGAVGTAHAAVDFIQAAGASAFHSHTESVVVGFCNPGSATKYTSGVVESVTASSHANDVIRVICVSTSTQWGLNATLDFSYDSFGGSWKAFTATNSISIPSVPSINQEPVRTVDITTCSGSTTTVTISSQAVTLVAGCGETTPQTTGGATSIGFTDVEPALFFSSVSENQPPSSAGVVFPASLGATSLQVPLLGVTWAVGAAKPLWLAMQADQVSAGILPSSCSGNIDESSQACAPFISKAQYKSIVQGNGDGDLHFDLVNLFTGTAPSGSLTLVRRDLGSGTQAAANAYFLNVGCAGTRALASQKTTVSGGMTVSINASTGLVQNGLKAAVYGVGHFSADKCPTSGTTFTGTTTGSYGCLKLANTGVSTRTVAGQVTGTIGYPVSANVTTGYYDYTSEEQMYVKAGASAAETKFAQNVQTVAATSTNSAGFYNLTPLTTQPLTVPTTGTYYRVGTATTTGGAFAGGSNMCQGLVDTY